jgi:probable rRNA maturation factor
MRSRVKGQGSRVKVNNLHRSFKINETFATKIAARVLGLINKDGRADLEIVFLDDAAIRKLNRAYKGESVPTDVLSFGIDRREFGEKKFLGEIFISLDTARRNAKIFGAAFEEEVVLYVIHGILHLFGYDDLTAVERARMSRKQERILKALCRQETLSKVLTRR